MNCDPHLSSSVSLRMVKVQDKRDLRILVFNKCGLTSLSGTNYIKDDFYRKSGILGAYLKPMEIWLKDKIGLIGVVLK